MIKYIFLLLSMLFVFPACDDNDACYYATFKINAKKMVLENKKGKEGLEHLNTYPRYSGVWIKDNAYYLKYVHLNISLPLSVGAGSIYDENSDFFNISIVPDYTNHSHGNRSSYPFSLEVTEWGGIGGTIKGVFSGTLVDTVTNSDTITITEGTFELDITDYRYND